MSPEAALVKVRVAAGSQLSFDDRLHAEGSELSVPEHIAERWIVRGWAEPIEPREPKAASSSARSRRTR